MGKGMRLFASGLGAALAIGLPAALLANIIAELGDLPQGVSSFLLLVVFTGTVVGGGVVGRSGPRMAGVQAALVGAVAIALIATFGYVRRTVSGEDVDPLVIPALAAFGALFGVIGGAVGHARAARTRP
jgi:hypothetical protein